MQYFCMIEQETIRTVFWLAVAIVMILILLGLMFLFGVKNLNIVVGG